MGSPIRPLPLGHLILAKLICFLEVLDNRPTHHLRHVEAVSILPFGALHVSVNDSGSVKSPGCEVIAERSCPQESPEWTC